MNSDSLVVVQSPCWYPKGVDDEIAKLCEHVARYAGFNAARTLGTAGPSRFAVRRFSRAIALLDPARPGSAMANRVLGFSEADLGRLADVFALYEAAGEPARFDVADRDATPALRNALARCGMQPAQTLIYLDGAYPAAKPRSKGAPDTAVRVRRWGPARADAFLALLQTAGGTCKPEVWDVRRAFYCTDTFRTFVASYDGSPCAWATSYVDGSVGYFANVYAQPAYRNRGCHAALLRARLDDAAELGLDRVLTDVLPDSQSLRNCIRAGLRPLAVLTLWQRPA